MHGQNNSVSNLCLVIYRRIINKNWELLQWDTWLFSKFEAESRAELARNPLIFPIPPVVQHGALTSSSTASSTTPTTSNRDHYYHACPLSEIQNTHTGTKTHIKINAKRKPRTWSYFFASCSLLCHGKEKGWYTLWTRYTHIFSGKHRQIPDLVSNPLSPQRWVYCITSSAAEIGGVWVRDYTWLTTTIIIIAFLETRNSQHHVRHWKQHGNILQARVRETSQMQLIHLRTHVVIWCTEFVILLLFSNPTVQCRVAYCHTHGNKRERQTHKLRFGGFTIKSVTDGQKYVEFNTELRGTIRRGQVRQKRAQN